MPPAPDATAHALQLVLVWGLLPLWIAAGLADAACHWRLRIEHSAGWPESLLHLVMIAELGTGILAAALLQVNAAVLSLLLLLCVLHDVTLLVDLAYAEQQRGIPAFEQWVHGVQQALPWVAWLVLAVVHRDQVLAAVGAGGTADWGFAGRSEPLPVAVWWLVGGGGAAVTASFVAEAVRAARAAPARG